MPSTKGLLGRTFAIAICIKFRSTEAFTLLFSMANELVNALASCAKGLEFKLRADQILQCCRWFATASTCTQVGVLP